MLSMFTFYNFEMFVLFINELDFILDYLIRYENISINIDNEKPVS